MRLNATVTIRATFACLARDTRIGLCKTQQQLAEAVGVSRGHVSKIEAGKANPSLDLVERMAASLDLEIELLARRPVVVDNGRQRDFVHARCPAHVDNRLRNGGWRPAGEVEIVHGRSHGWIDLLAYDPSAAALLVIEIKTRLDDLGAVERQIGWYERSAFDVARGLGWAPRRVIGWLLVLATDEVEAVLRANRDLMAQAFPDRAREMLLRLADPGGSAGRRGLALVDPTSKRRDWLIASRIDGRRSPAPFSGYGDAARRLDPRPSEAVPGRRAF